MILVAANVILLVGGQTLWKIGLDRVGGLTFQQIQPVLLSPYIWAGIVLYGLATICWLVVLSRLPLSVAYPLQSIAYVLGVFVAHVYFHESIPLNRMLGVALILLGIVSLSIK